MKLFTIGIVAYFIIGLCLDIYHIYKDRKIDENVASTIMIELVVITWGIVALVLE